MVLSCSLNLVCNHNNIVLRLHTLIEVELRDLMAYLSSLCFAFGVLFLLLFIMIMGINIMPKTMPRVTMIPTAGTTVMIGDSKVLCDIVVEVILLLSVDVV